MYFIYAFMLIYFLSIHSTSDEKAASAHLKAAQIAESVDDDCAANWLTNKTKSVKSLSS